MKYVYNKLVRDKIPEEINNIEGRKAINIRLKDIYTFSNSQIAVIGTYLTQNKQTIFGGRYE